MLPCPSAGGHFSTFFRTAATHLGTPPAMLVLRLLALGGARVTQGGAQLQGIGDKARVTANERGAIPTEVRAVNTESRAFRHFAKTLITAGFALFRTSDTGVHAELILMSHGRKLLSFLFTNAVRRLPRSRRKGLLRFDEKDDLEVTVRRPEVRTAF